MMQIINKIISFFTRLFTNSTNNELDNDILNKKKEIGRIENEPRKIDDIVNDLNKHK